mgnify:CR=1 FL=1
MSVYNDATRVEGSVASVLAQTFRDLEVIIVNDGSTDETGGALDRIARTDARIKVIHQENVGLTLSLKRACALARGKYIVRHDSGDHSDHGRFAEQIDLLESRPGVVLTSCGTSFLAPGGEHVFEVAPAGDQLHEGLSEPKVNALRGPSHHGSCTFRRDDYESVGGYRVEFKAAQDIDLWLRLSERGQCLGTNTVRYSAVIDPGGISSLNGARQRAYSEAALRCAKLRRDGQSDKPELVAIATWKPLRVVQTPQQKAAFNYFVGNCLLASDRAAARSYLLQAVELNPFHVRAWLGIVRTLV